MRRVCIGLAAVAVVFALAPAALAQESSGVGYGGEGGGVAGQVEGGDGGAAGQAGGGNAASEASDADESGLLPFTGLDVALILGGGLLLLAGGVALSRIVARNTA